jgi:AraC-like DNA-binding protein
MRATQFVESYFDAWNHYDAKGIADHLSADGIYCDIPENLRSSPDELIVGLNDFFANFRHRYELIGEILKSENTIAFQYRIFGCDNGRSREAPVSYHGAEFMTLHGDAAIAITDYYDAPVTTSVSKYAKSGLTKNQLLRHKQRLDQVMHSQMAYLQPDLTLPKLAKAVGCSVNHLSQVINSGFGTSFFDYLNRYRIDHARELLTELDGQNTAILNIALTVGFNSNSAFYAAFKKHLGITPAQYRLRYLNNCHKKP